MINGERQDIREGRLVISCISKNNNISQTEEDAVLIRTEPISLSFLYTLLVFFFLLFMSNNEP